MLFDVVEASDDSSREAEKEKDDETTWPQDEQRKRVRRPGVDAPQESLAKAALATQIARIINAKRMSQVAVARARRRATESLRARSWSTHRVLNRAPHQTRRARCWPSRGYDGVNGFVLHARSHRQSQRRQKCCTGDMTNAECEHRSSLGPSNWKSPRRSPPNQTAEPTESGQSFTLRAVTAEHENILTRQEVPMLFDGEVDALADDFGHWHRSLLFEQLQQLVLFGCQVDRRADFLASHWEPLSRTSSSCYFGQLRGAFVTARPSQSLSHT